LTPATVTINSERRVNAPYGLQGGEAGKQGVNHITRTDGEAHTVGGKYTTQVTNGDKLTIETPGGGGWGDD
jgi:N-methylhydantoinase B/oxoprolinase/acetone carboxylase alpha subunit